MTKLQPFFLTLDPQFSIIFILKKVSAIPKRVDHFNKKLTRPLLIVCSVVPLISQMFKFGGGEIMRSKGEYSLPAVVAGKDVMIRTDVVGSDIPLLLSRSAMKTTGVKMDMENDTANIFGKMFP